MVAGLFETHRAYYVNRAYYVLDLKSSMYVLTVTSEQSVS